MNAVCLKQALTSMVKLTKELFVPKITETTIKKLVQVFLCFAVTLTANAVEIDTEYCNAVENRKFAPSDYKRSYFGQGLIAQNKYAKWDPHVWVYRKDYKERFLMPERWQSQALKGVQAMAFKVHQASSRMCESKEGGQCHSFKRCKLDLYIQTSKSLLTERAEPVYFDAATEDHAYRFLSPQNKADIQKWNSDRDKFNVPATWLRTKANCEQSRNELRLIRYHRSIYKNLDYLTYEGSCAWFANKDHDSTQAARIELSLDNGNTHTVIVPSDYLQRINEPVEYYTKDRPDFFQAWWQDVQLDAQQPLTYQQRFSAQGARAQGRQYYLEDINEWAYDAGFAQRFGMPKKWVNTQELWGARGAASRTILKSWSGTPRVVEVFMDAERLKPMWKTSRPRMFYSYYGGSSINHRSYALVSDRPKCGKANDYVNPEEEDMGINIRLYSGWVGRGWYSDIKRWLGLTDKPGSGNSAGTKSWSRDVYGELNGFVGKVLSSSVFRDLVWSFDNRERSQDAKQWWIELEKGRLKMREPYRNEENRQFAVIPQELMLNLHGVGRHWESWPSWLTGEWEKRNARRNKQRGKYKKFTAWELSEMRKENKK